MKYLRRPTPTHYQSPHWTMALNLLWSCKGALRSRKSTVGNVQSVCNANQATLNRACHYTPRQSQGAPARASGSRGSSSDSRRRTDDWTASLWCASVRPNSGRSSSSKPGSCAARRRRLSSASTRKRPAVLSSPKNKVQNPCILKSTLWWST
jgi:hypothetical protein